MTTSGSGWKPWGRALPHIEVKITDPETGNALSPGEQGEVCCRGYNIMKGYYNNPEATKKAIDDDGWLHTGDLGVMDDQGNLAITGRHKDMIIRGGENIYPREIEEFLIRMDGIRDIQVAAVPSPNTGRGGCVHHSQRRGRPAAQRYHRFLQRQDQPVQNSPVCAFCKGLSHDRVRQDPEIQTHGNVRTDLPERR